MSDEADFWAAFMRLHAGLPRQAPGSDATTRELLRLAGPLPAAPKVIDFGCGSGQAALLLAAETGGRVTAVDLHQPFLDQLTDEARRRGLAERITPVNRSMADVEAYPRGDFDLIWSEGAAYAIGFDLALRTWRELLRPGGTLVVTEAEWDTDAPSEASRAFWADYPGMRDAAANIAAAEAAGYRVVHAGKVPDEDWYEYYTPLAANLAAADPTEPGMAAAAEATRAELDLRRDHPGDYRYAAYVLRRD